MQNTNCFIQALIKIIHRKNSHFPGSRAKNNLQFRRIYIKTGLTKKQRVTEVYYNAKKSTAEVYTHDTKLKKWPLTYASLLCGITYFMKAKHPARFLVMQGDE